MSLFFATGLAIFPVVVRAGTVDDLIDQPSTMQVSVGSNHKFTFTVTSVVSESSTISIVFPSGFDLSALGEDDLDIADDGIDLSTSSDCSGSDQVSVGFSGQTILLTICSGDGGTIANSSVVTIEIGTNAASFGFGTHRIINPSAVASYFVAISETGGNSGSVVLTTTTTGSSSVTATVPDSGGGAEGGGGAGGGDTGGDSGTPDAPTDGDTPADTPTEPSADVPADTPTDTAPSTDAVTSDGGADSGDSGSANGEGGSSEGSADGGSSGRANRDELVEESEDSEDGSGIILEEIDVTEEEGTEELPESSGEVGVVEGDIETPSGSTSESGTTKPPKAQTFAPTFSSVVTTFTDSVQAVSERLDEIRELPEVQTAVDIAVPVTVATAVSTTVVLATSFNLLSYLQFMFTSPLLFIARRKRKAFGIVYNSVTKVAVDLAIVRLYSVTTNRLVKSVVTDGEGKYFFVVDPGQYRLTVTKGGFIFPSTDLAGVKDDGVFLDVYTGQTIAVTQHDATIAANVPLDIAQGQKAQEPNGIARRRFLRKLQFVFSFSGSLLSVLVYIFSPSVFTFGLAIGQVVVFLVFRHLAHTKKPRGWGVVYDASTRRPVGNAVVRLFEPKYNKLVETTLTDTLGRYSFLVGPNEYFVSTNREGYEERIIRPIDYRDRREPEPLAIDVPMEPKKP